MADRSYTFNWANLPYSGDIQIVQVEFADGIVIPTEDVTVEWWQANNPDEKGSVTLYFGGETQSDFSRWYPEIRRNGTISNNIYGISTYNVILNSGLVATGDTELFVRVTADESLFENGILTSFNYQVGNIALSPGGAGAAETGFVDFLSLTPDSSSGGDDPIIVESINSDVSATKSAIEDYVATHYNPTLPELGVLVVATDDNLITVSINGDIITINGSNPAVSYTATATVVVPEDPAIPDSIDSDVAQTKANIEAYIIVNPLPTENQLQAQAFTTNDNVITVSYSNWVATITGSNPATTHTATATVNVPQVDDPAIIASIDSDVEATKNAIEAVIYPEITQFEITALIVKTGTNQVTATLANSQIIITGSNPAVEYVKSETIAVPEAPTDDPEIVASILADVAATKAALVAYDDPYLTQSQVDTLTVQTGTNVIKGTLTNREVIITGSNPAVVFSKSDSYMLPDVPVEPEEDEERFRWVLYNTLTGNIIQTLEVSDDDVYLDINNGDDATITVPAYALTAEQRKNWTTFFKPWARGIALIDRVLDINAFQKVIFAGPIDKRSFSAKSELITVTAYSQYEVLKKLEAYPIWNEVTDANLSKVLTGDSWAGIYSGVLKSGISTVGAPAGWKPIATYYNLPNSVGTAHSITLKAADQEKISEVFERIRDELSGEKSVEFRLVPKMATQANTKLVWELHTGTDTAKHINFTDLIVKLDENTANTWQVNDYELDDDATLIYNKIVINGLTGDAVRIKQKTDFISDPEMPGLTEFFDPGVDLTSTQQQAQLDARIKGSLITEKTLSLTIAGDRNLEWFGYLGRKVIATPGTKTAGAGATARAVGIRFSTKTLETALEVDLMRIANKYPKLPKQIETEIIGGGDHYDNILDSPTGIGYGDINDGGGSGGIVGINPDGSISGGEVYIPDYPSTDGEGGVGTDDELILSDSSIEAFGNTFSTNISKAGYVYSLIIGTDLTNGNYNNTTDIISGIKINIEKVSTNKEAYQELSIKTETISEYIIEDNLLNEIDYNLPENIKFTNIGGEVPEEIQIEPSHPAGEIVYLPMSIFEAENKLYVWAAKRRTYSSRFTRIMPISLIFDINPETGELSNGTKGPAFAEGLVPEETAILPGTPYIYGSTIRFNVPHVRRGEKVYFFNPTIFVDRQFALDGSVFAWDYNYIKDKYLDFGLTQTELMGDLKPIVMDISAPGYPVFEWLDTELPFNKTKYNAGNGLVYKGGSEFEESNFDIYTGRRGVSTQEFIDLYLGPSRPLSWISLTEDTDKKYLYLTWGWNGSETYSAYYENGVEDAKENNNLVYRYNIAANSWKKVNQLINKIEGLDTEAYQNSVPLGIKATPWVKIPYIAYEIEPKNSSFVLENNSGDFRIALSGSIESNSGVSGITSSETIKDEDKALVIYNKDGYGAKQIAHTGVPNPYKQKALHANSNCITDTQGRLWTWGLRGLGIHYAPAYYQQTIPMLAPGTKKFKGTSGSTIARLYVDEEGFMWAIGSGVNYALGFEHNEDVTALTKVNDVKWKRVIYNATCGAGLDIEGYLWTWGSNVGGKTAQGTDSGYTITPKRISDKKWIEFDFYDALVAVDENRDYYYAGSVFGRPASNVMTKLNDGKKWRNAYSGANHYGGIAIDNKYYAWGSNDSGKTGLDQSQGSTEPLLQASGYGQAKIIKAVLNADITALLTEEGIIYAAGHKDRTGIGSDEDTLTFKKVVMLDGENADFDNIYYAGRSFIGIKKDGTAYTPYAPDSGSYSYSPATTKMVLIFGGSDLKPSGEGEDIPPGYGGGASSGTGTAGGAQGGGGDGR